MSMQLKAQVLAISPSSKRTYNGRSWHQRQMQCFLLEKVAVHNVNAPDGDDAEAVLARQRIDALLPGDYVFTVEPVQGDRGRLEFAVIDVKPYVKGVNSDK